MRIWLIVFLCILSLAGAAERKELFSFELGEVEKPGGTVESTRAIQDGKVYMFAREKPFPAVYMLTVINQGTSIGEDSPGVVKAFVEGYCRKLSESLGMELASVQTIPQDRGCVFFFDVVGGRRNYGELLLGRTRMLVFTGLGVTRAEMRRFRESFETMPGQFEKPLSRTESANRAAAGYCWIAGGLNLLIAPICALVAFWMGHRFWLSVRDTMLILYGLEFVGGIVYSYYRWRDVGLSGSIAVAVFAGLLVTTGVPALAAHWLSQMRRASG